MAQPPDDDPPCRGIARIQTRPIPATRWPLSHRLLEKRMKSLLMKQGGLCASLVTACAFIWSGHAQANDCVIELALGSGKDNYVFNTHANAREIGYWDVDNGGASGDG